jgi:hypothetical protein
LSGSNVAAKKKWKMKKFTLCLTFFSLLVLTVSAPLKAVTIDANLIEGDSVTVAEIALVHTLSARLDEITLIDKASLRPAERRALRREVRSINKQLKAADSGGVYISVGALLIVIILLILLL